MCMMVTTGRRSASRNSCPKSDCYAARFLIASNGIYHATITALVSRLSFAWTAYVINASMLMGYSIWLCPRCVIHPGLSLKQSVVLFCVDLVMNSCIFPGCFNHQASDPSGSCASYVLQ
jgi:hypothetical protein